MWLAMFQEFWHINAKTKWNRMTLLECIKLVNVLHFRNIPSHNDLDSQIKIIVRISLVLNDTLVRKINFPNFTVYQV